MKLSALNVDELMAYASNICVESTELELALISKLLESEKEVERVTGVFERIEKIVDLEI